MREKQIDVLKAFGIILVIIGHTASPLNGWIYTFHMPLFFFISGFLRFGGTRKSWGKFLLGKAGSSLLPYLLFWFVTSVLFRNLYNIILSGSTVFYGWNALKGLLLGGHWLAEYSNNFPLWYLQHYFIACIVFELMVRYLRPVLKIAAGILLLLATVPLQAAMPVRPVFHINILPAALVFMLAGYGFRFLLQRKPAVGQLCGFWPAGFLLMLLGWGISSVHKGNIATIRSYLYFVGALCTIVGLYIISDKLKSLRVLEYIGQRTLYIMGLHMMMLAGAALLVPRLLPVAALQNPVQICLALLLCCIAADIWMATRRFLSRLVQRSTRP